LGFSSGLDDINTSPSQSPDVVRHFKMTMRFNLLIWTFFILTSCNLKEQQNVQLNKESSLFQVDTPQVKVDKAEQTLYDGYYDSLAKAYVDTSTLKGKREWIMNHFLIENTPSSSDYDTLFDITYDGFKDYVIGYYGQAGTGIKNRVKVFFYDPKNNCYILNEQLSDLPNPTFYIKQKKITGFYIGNGGGGGGRLEWLNGKWTTTKEFDVDKEGDTTKWIISYPLKRKNEIIVRPFQMIPPKDILETDIKW
jgi:hypothetical protein